MKLFILVTAIPLALILVIYALGTLRRSRARKGADGGGAPLALASTSNSGSRRDPDQLGEESGGDCGGGDGGGD